MSTRSGSGTRKDGGKAAYHLALLRGALILALIAVGSEGSVAGAVAPPSSSGPAVASARDASQAEGRTFTVPVLMYHRITCAPSDARFFTAVAAAETFVRMRMKSKYRDLIALIEFGDESYVITPFTNDYDNILLSISLIDDLTEFNKFPDQGTTIGMAINQSVRLFTAFDFLNASGNLMVIFSDGEDTKVSGPRLGGLNVDQILSGATQAKIPVYFIRTSYNKGLGRAFTDPIWKPVVEKTGGKFYAASDEATIISAIQGETEDA